MDSAARRSLSRALLTIHLGSYASGDITTYSQSWSLLLPC